MIPIAKTFDLKTILKTQEQYESANIFGFIAFTKSDANVVKVMRDEDYWDSFDEDSKGWLIFSVKPLEKGSVRLPNYPEGTMGMMVPIWDEPNANKEYIKLFGLKDTQKLPLFIVFAVIDNEIQKFTFQIKDESVDEANNSIRCIIRDITAHLNGVLPEYRQSENVYGVIERGVKGPREFKEFLAKLKPIYNTVQSVKSIIAP